MIRDVPRTEAFRQAIKAVVKPGDVVLDVGAGTGILSLFAAQAGAARVYAVERTGIAAMAVHLARINGRGDSFAVAPSTGCIHVLQGDVRTIQLPEKVDVIVSEWMGSIGVDENMLGAVLWARDHFLKPKGRLIPSIVTAWMAPVSTDLRPDARFFIDRPYDLDLNPLVEPSIHELLMIRRRIRPSDLAAPAQKMWSNEVATDLPTSVSQPYRAELRFTLNKDAKVSALAAWFTSDLTSGIHLSNAPDAPETHWGQLMLPLDNELSLKSGDVLEAEIIARSVNSGPLHFAWSVRVNDDSSQKHDTQDLRPVGCAVEPTGSEQIEIDRSALSRFLADLAIDSDLLSAFLSDPDQTMAAHSIPIAQQAALKSRDPQCIQSALYEMR
jgi:predicted RNA methylase